MAFLPQRAMKRAMATEDKVKSPKILKMKKKKIENSSKLTSKQVIELDCGYTRRHLEHSVF